MKGLILDGEIFLSTRHAFLDSHLTSPSHTRRDRPMDDEVFWLGPKTRVWSSRTHTNLCPAIKSLIFFPECHKDIQCLNSLSSLNEFFISEKVSMFCNAMCNAITCLFLEVVKGLGVLAWFTYFDTASFLDSVLSALSLNIFLCLVSKCLLILDVRHTTFLYT